jgi:hypothetical protein
MVLLTHGTASSRNFLDILYKTSNKIAEEGLCQLHRLLAKIMFLGSLTVELAHYLLTSGAATALPLSIFFHKTEIE